MRIKELIMITKDELSRVLKKFFQLVLNILYKDQ